MSSSLETLKSAKTILLTTYKRDGAPVSTAVSVAFDGERAFFRSYDKAWKTKRLRNNPNVQVAPATFRGKPAGAAFDARARLLSGEEARLASGALARRHRFLQALVVPFAHRLMHYRTMHYGLEPAPSPTGAGRSGGVTRPAAVSSHAHNADSQANGS